MALIGYARVNSSKVLDKLDEQISLLKDKGCTDVYTDVASGMDKSRPGLADALAALTAGDVLVVKDIDRLSRDWRHKNEIACDIIAREVGFKSLTEHIYVASRRLDLALGCFNLQMQRYLDEQEHSRQANTMSAGRASGNG